MALNEVKVVDKIEVLETGTIQVREATRVFRGVELVAQTFTRWVFAPGSDVRGMPDNVQAIARTVWTPEVVAAYQAQIAAQEAQRA